MNFLFALLLFSVVAPSFAQPINPYLARPECLKPMNKNKGVMLKTIPPVKDQDGIGLCYAFSSALLLEQLNCRQMKGDCNHPSLRISTLDLAAHAGLGRGILEGGQPVSALAEVAIRGLKRNRRGKFSVVREQCAPYSRLRPIERIENETELLTPRAQDRSTPQHPIRLEPGIGWANLQHLFKAIRVAKSKAEWNQCKASASPALPDLKERIGEIQFELAKSFEEFSEFASLVLIPQECEEPGQVLELPPFGVGIFPAKNPVSPKAIWERAQELIAQNAMTELSMCVKTDKDRICKEAHTVALVGARECCDEHGNCHRSFRIQNSYGVNWQEKFSDGWVDASVLLDAALINKKTGILTWVQADGENFSFKLTEDETRKPIHNRPTERSEVAPPKPNPRPVPGRIFRCILPSGKVEFRDQPVGNCRPFN